MSERKLAKMDNGECRNAVFIYCFYVLKYKCSECGIDFNNHYQINPIYESNDHYKFMKFGAKVYPEDYKRRIIELNKRSYIPRKARSLIITKT